MSFKRARKFILRPPYQPRATNHPHHTPSYFSSIPFRPLPPSFLSLSLSLALYTRRFMKRSTHVVRKQNSAEMIKAKSVRHSGADRLRVFTPAVACLNVTVLFHPTRLRLPMDSFHPLHLSFLTASSRPTIPYLSPTGSRHASTVTRFDSLARSSVDREQFPLFRLPLTASSEL